MLVLCVATHKTSWSLPNAHQDLRMKRRQRERYWRYIQTLGLSYSSHPQPSRFQSTMSSKPFKKVATKVKRIPRQRCRCTTRTSAISLMTRWKWSNRTRHLEKHATKARRMRRWTAFKGSARMVYTPSSSDPSSSLLRCGNSHCFCSSFRALNESERTRGGGWVESIWSAVGMGRGLWT